MYASHVVKGEQDERETVSVPGGSGKETEGGGRPSDGRAPGPEKARSRKHEAGVRQRMGNSTPRSHVQVRIQGRQKRQKRKIYSFV